MSAAIKKKQPFLLSLRLGKQVQKIFKSSFEEFLKNNFS